MQSLIVLGIIPGTDIQTNLNFWILMYALIAIVAFRAQLFAMRAYVQRQLTIFRIAHTINSFEFNTRN